MNSYRAIVTSKQVMNGQVEFTTYVGAKSFKAARKQLEREGFDVISMEVLILSN